MKNERSAMTHSSYFLFKGSDAYLSTNVRGYLLLQKNVRSSDELWIKHSPAMSINMCFTLDLNPFPSDIRNVYSLALSTFSSKPVLYLLHFKYYHSTTQWNIQRYLPNTVHSKICVGFYSFRRSEILICISLSPRHMPIVSYVRWSCRCWCWQPLFNQLPYGHSS